MRQKLLILSLLISSLFLGSKTYAQDFLPDAIQNIFQLLGPDGTGATFFVTSRVQALLLIGLAILVLASVVYAAFAAFKYIRSQGDPGQVEEAGKAVKSIFLGLVVLLFAIVGIVLIFVFFGAEFIGTETFQTCLSAPNSRGCVACTSDSTSPLGTGGLRDNFDTNRFTSYVDQGALLASFPGGAGGGTGNENTCTTCEYLYFRISEEALIGGAWRGGAPPPPPPFIPTRADLSTIAPPCI